jgi:hypothetical protein
MSAGEQSRPDVDPAMGADRADPRKQAGSVAAGHELRDVSFRPIISAAVGLATVIVLVVIAMRFLFVYYAAREATSSPAPNPLAAEFARNEPPLPRLQTAPIEDLHKLRKVEDTLLGTYGWIDRDAGVARLPIDRAMDLLAERGLPAGREGAAGK